MNLVLEEDDDDGFSAPSFCSLNLVVNSRPVCILHTNLNNSSGNALRRPSRASICIAGICLPNHTHGMLRHFD
jgi:hypothetical protein